MNIIQEDLFCINQNEEILWETFNHSSFLISGGNGMIPSYVALALLYRTKIRADFNIQVTIMTRNLIRSQQLYADFKDSPILDFWECDIRDVNGADRNYDYIIHGVSPADPRKFGLEPENTFLTNITGTYNLLKLAEGCACKGFIYFSSDEIYGKISEKISLVKEDTYGVIDPLDIRSCYSERKRGGELLCSIFAHSKYLPVKIVRLSHNFGPTMNIEDDSRVFAEFVRNIVSRENIVMKSDGSAVRSFCYLTDAVEGILLILLKGKIGEAYNLCGDEEFSILELANLLCGLFPEYNLSVIQQNRQQGDCYLERATDKRIGTDTRKLKALGWQVKTSVKDGFLRTVKSMEETK